MLSFPDIAILSGLGLVIFGPERLPSIAHQVGQAVGTLRTTAQGFVREMELAATPLIPPVYPAAHINEDPLELRDSASSEIHSDGQR